MIHVALANIESQVIKGMVLEAPVNSIAYDESDKPILIEKGAILDYTNKINGIKTLLYLAKNKNNNVYPNGCLNEREIINATKTVANTSTTAMLKMR
jgi:hypothetical protein